MPHALELLAVDATGISIAIAAASLVLAIAENRRAHRAEQGAERA